MFCYFWTYIDSAKESIYKGFSSNVLKLLSDEGEIEASYVLGERYYKEGKIDEAVVEFEKLLDDEDERCVDKLINIYNLNHKREWFNLTPSINFRYLLF